MQFLSFGWSSNACHNDRSRSDFICDAPGSSEEKQKRFRKHKSPFRPVMVTGSTTLQLFRSWTGRAAPRYIPGRASVPSGSSGARYRSRQAQTNGMVERFNGRISELVGQTRFAHACPPIRRLAACDIVLKEDFMVVLPCCCQIVRPSSDQCPRKACVAAVSNRVPSMTTPKLARAMATSINPSSTSSSTSWGARCIGSP